ncbi:beta-N-acetylhexosaminidase [Actinocatenispora rupis]|uniref:beta-N-acetylhexosaminidase n=1 Tax=Actinocatenispora rupis TaxID=519421 RepID=A0A8J3NG71_9ACTN|nr:beta-N-acetylhexosaminidase [Actinocatenispora rupis]GID16087.1 beta-N-acetylhexosaminidase [Actinocatenispora rupis]
MTDRYDTLVPRPREARRLPGTVTLTADSPLSGPDAATDVVRALLAPLGLPLRPNGSGVPVTVETGADTEPEGYRLRVAEDGVHLAASTLDGVRHAVRALRQLLPDAAWRAAAPDSTQWTVECGEIDDAPALSWRGGMLDVSRHFLPKHVVLRYVDLLAMHGYNRLHLHLTDDQGWRIQSRKYPRLTEVGAHRPGTQVGKERDGSHDNVPHGGFYTLDDLTEITAYAQARGVVVVPEIDLPGHASALLAAYPEYGVGEHAVHTGWGISAGVVRPVPATVRFLAEILDELAEAVPGPYIHLGGDECILRDWVTDPEISAYLAELGYTEPVELHGHFLRTLGEHLSAAGRRMVVWDEGYVTGGVLSDTVVTAWRGTGVGQRAAAAGYDVVRCPVYPTYLDYDQSDSPDEQLSIGGPLTLDDVAGFDPVPADWTETERAHVVGVQWQSWAEYIPNPRHLDYMVWPRACALADVAWTGAPAVDITERLRVHLGRLDAAGVEYRPLDGPHPWQAGGTGARRRLPGAEMAKLRGWLEEISQKADVEEESA